MHYMPWFTLKPRDGHWTMQLDQKDGMYLMDRYRSAGRVASHFTPLIGPYDSSDGKTISLHLELMRLAGVKGVIVDWYGIGGGGLSDELVASDAVIAETSSSGMLWSLCYEDRTIGWRGAASASAQAAMLEADWVYIRDRYIRRRAGVLRDPSTGRPIFLVFGPTTVMDTAIWTSTLARVFPQEGERPLLLGTDRASANVVAPDGNFMWPGWGIGTRESVAHANEVFYDRASQQGFEPVVGVAFPRFKDYYRQGYVGSSPEHWWGIDVPAASGATLDACMSAARSRGAALVQV